MTSLVSELSFRPTVRHFFMTRSMKMQNCKKLRKETMDRLKGSVPFVIGSPGHEFQVYGIPQAIRRHSQLLSVIPEEILSSAPYVRLFPNDDTIDPNSPAFSWLWLQLNGHIDHTSWSLLPPDQQKLVQCYLKKFKVFVGSHIFDEMNTREVAILFLAHNGINNPDLWDRWRRENASVKVKFYVFVNPDVPLPSSWNKYRLDTVMETAWCDRSIVYATQAAIAEILRKSAHVSVIYLVSGADVPVQPVKKVYNEPDATYMLLNPWPYPSKELDKYFLSELTKLNEEAEKKIGKGFQISKLLRMHDQWVVLTRYDAEVFVSTSLEYMDIIDKWFTEHPTITDPFIEMLIKKRFPAPPAALKHLVNASPAALEHLRSSRLTWKPCPDNYYVYATLRLAVLLHNAELTPIFNETRTRWISAKAEFLDLEIPNRPEIVEYSSSSPYEFTDWTSKKYNVMSKNKDLYLSLEDIIMMIRNNDPNIFFFRKVARGAIPDNVMPWSLNDPSLP